MAYVEPMDVDNIGSDFDDKENSLQNSNVLSRTQCVEKGYEELDVSELNMKLRYSITPASSPMSKSYLTNQKEKCVNQENISNMKENVNLSHSLNSTLTKSDTPTKSPKLPLQVVLSDQFINSTVTPLMPRSINCDTNNCTITLTGPENDENLSLPSTSSSSVHTPEATTPTKDMTKSDSGSPIIRGLKSVLNMFRSSQSPIPPEEISNIEVSPEQSVNKEMSLPTGTLASTPISSCKNKDNNSKRNSPLKESVIFNDDLEKELEWKEETTIIFKQEKIPIHKLLFQETISAPVQKQFKKVNENLNSTVEYMDISHNEPGIADNTITEVANEYISNIEAAGGFESDSEFLDCETTYTKSEEIALPQKDVLISTNNNKTEDTKSKIEEVENVNEKYLALYDDNSNFSNETTESTQCHIKTELNVTYEQSANLDEAILPDIKSSDVIPTISAPINSFDLNNITNVTHNICENLNQPLLTSSDNINQNSEDKIVSVENVIDNETTLSESNGSEIKNEPGFEIEDSCPYDITKPLNIITNYENNPDISVKSDRKNDSCADSSQNIGLLKKYEIDENAQTVVCIESIEDNRNVILDNTMTDLTPNLIQDESHTSLDNNAKDISSIQTIETIKVDSLNEKTIINDNEYNIKLDINSSKNNFSDLDTISNNVSTKRQDNNEANNNIENMGCKLEETKKEEIDGVSGIQEPLLNVPSEYPLPYDDDVDSQHIINEAIECDLNNTVIVHNYSNDKFLGKESNDLDEEAMILENMEILPAEATTNISFETDNTTKATYKSETSDEVIDKLENTNTNIILNVNNDNKFSLNDDLNKVNLIQEKNICMKGVAENKIVTPSNNLSSSELNAHEKYTKIENISNPFETKVKLRESPPLSPKSDQQGYDIGFDKINDPFATKTKIRTSPTPESPLVHMVKNENKIEQKHLQMHNRRKSQPVRKNVKYSKTKFNKSFESGLSKYTNEPKDSSQTEKIDETIKISKEDVLLDKNNVDEDIVSTFNNTQTINNSFSIANIEVHDVQIDDKDRIDLCNVEQPMEIELINDNKLENINDINTYNEEEKKLYEHEFSEKFVPSNSRSVFNIPEIDDINFNPFATKWKVRESPTPISDTLVDEMNEIKSELQTSNDVKFDVGSEDTNSESQSAVDTKIHIEIQYKPICVNDITVNCENTVQEQNQLSPNTSSNSSEDKENTVCEVPTEDEDTIEGPFFGSDELIETEKLSEFEVNHEMTPFDDFPVETNTGKKEEIFIDAEAFEFLLNQNKSNVVADSGKESLFLKFDPLFAKRVSSDGVLSALNKIQKKQSTPLKADKINETVEQLPSTSSLSRTVSEECNDESNVVVPKPMMVVNPAVNSLVSPRKSMTPPRVNRRSLTFTSPAMAVIDKLLSLSGNNSLLEQDITVSHPTRECNNTDIALTQLRELLAEKEIHVHNLRSEAKELKERLSVMELQVKALEEESSKRLRKVNDLNERLAEKTKINKSMAVVVEEYERTIASLIAEMDQEKRRNAEERKILICERDEQTAHLASMEVSFSDLHSKYEKSKQIIISMKANEDTYKKSIREFEDNLLKMQKNYEMLKQHATSKLNYANQELEKLNKSHEAEVLKLNAMIKRKDLHITSLEESLTQKTKANEELTAICDELINKVG